VDTLWFTLIFMLALKIPIVYLCYVIWWALKEPPQPGEGGGGPAADGDPGGPSSGSSWWWRRIARNGSRRGPHGAPARRPQHAVAQQRTKTHT
jgi:hypothetical protein